jgi:chromosome segregation ATPase
VLATMNSSNKINTAVLESHVKDVLTSAKSKLNDLNKDIDKLTKENDDLQKQVDQSNF